LKLRAMGGQTGDDSSFIRRMREKLARNRVESDVEIMAAFDRRSRMDFLRSVTVMSVPSSVPEAFGLFIIESLAAGVPVVQPKTGGYPELVGATGGGVCYEPNNAATLAKNLEELLLDPERAAQMGRAGRKVVHERYNVRRMAEATLEIYRECQG
jgi:glycosyltransferase involved in cell wall biosynthesis